MNPSRDAKRKGQEENLQYRSRQETLGIEEATEEKLAQLHSFIEQLNRTPPGAAEFRRRIKLFGECKRIEGESSNQFYGRLRHWLDRDMPQAKAPLQARRQTGD